MERKYQITSATSIISMIVTFNEVGKTEPRTVRVGVDYANGRVWLEGESQLEGEPELDFGDLEQEILVHLLPPVLEGPKIPPEILQRIADVKAGKYYGDENVSKFQGFTR